MRPNITIAIPIPYLPIDEYCRITGTLPDRTSATIDAHCRK